MDTLQLVLGLVLGLSLFLFGMNIMGDALKRCGGSRMKSILSNLTSSRLKAVLLGLGVTAVIQSSSATTVMVVGFVNSGLMTLGQTIGIIMGANIGTSVTSWLTGLSGLSQSAATATGFLELLTPDTWMPILALIGLCLTMFAKKAGKKDVGMILLGFATLMVGMDLMSGAVSPLRKNEAFCELLIAFKNPFLGVLAGMLLTAVIQSSSASIGILQALALSTGAVSYGAAIPIIMGQNIGTCVTALLSSIGANKNAKRTSVIHLSFNIIGSLFWLIVFYTVNAFADFGFVNSPINMWGIAGIHTVFNILSFLLLFPFCNQLERFARFIIRDSKKDERTSPLDERLLATPSVAVERSESVTGEMARISSAAFADALPLLDAYDEETATKIRADEQSADEYEDMLGSYLIRLSSTDMSERDSHAVTKLLHVIGDFERISDHAVNIVESAEEIRDKKIVFSAEARHELSVLRGAVSEIVSLAESAYRERDLASAALVEPLEQVIDQLRDQIKFRHILRLQKSECTIEHGFVLSDILTNLERVADHCSNIAACILELSAHDALDLHRYTHNVREKGENFRQSYAAYRSKYSLGV